MIQKNGPANDNNSLDKAAPEQQELQSKFQIMFDHVSSGIATYEARDNGEDFILKDFNRAAEKIEKIKKEDVIGRSVLEVFPGVKDFSLFEVFQRVWRTGRAEHHPVSIYRDERMAGWRENYVSKLSSGALLVVYDDLTREKQSELTARTSEQCFRAIADYTYDWEIWVSPQGRLMWTNPASKRLTNYSPKELMAMKNFPLPVICDDDRERMGRALKSALRGGTGNNIQFRLERKDGGRMWAEMSWQPIYDDKKSFLGYRGSIRDITARKQAEQALRRSEKEMRIILDNLSEHVIYHDRELTILWANRAACESVGKSREELIGNHCYEFWGETEEPCEGCPVLASLRTGRKQDAKKQTPDGRLWFIRSTPVISGEGNITGAVEFTLDITERKRADDAQGKGKGQESKQW